VKLSADRSTRTLQITRNALVRAIRLAEINDLVGRNVAALAGVPAGTAGRPSKSLTLQQAKSLIEQARRSRQYVYVMLCLLTAAHPKKKARAAIGMVTGRRRMRRLRRSASASCCSWSS
jgi:hypothetical protein